MTTPAIRLRQGTIDDAETMAHYHYRCNVEAFGDLVPPGAIEAMDPLGRVERFRTWLTPRSGFATTVAEHHGSVVGHVTISGAQLVHLFIDPDHWGLGFGRTLLAAGESMLVEAGHRSVELHTRVGNHPAIRLYESAGWVMTDQILHQRQGDVPYDEHVLVKQIPGT